MAVPSFELLINLLDHPRRISQRTGSSIYGWAVTLLSVALLPRLIGLARGPVDSTPCRLFRFPFLGHRRNPTLSETDYETLPNADRASKGGKNQRSVGTLRYVKIMRYCTNTTLGLRYWWFLRFCIRQGLLGACGPIGRNHFFCMFGDCS